MEEWKLNVATDMDDVHVVDDVSICEPALYVIENDSTTQMNKWMYTQIGRIWILRFLDDDLEI